MSQGLVQDSNPSNFLQTYANGLIFFFMDRGEKGEHGSIKEHMVQAQGLMVIVICLKRCKEFMIKPIKDIGETIEV